MANHDHERRDFALSLPPALLSVSPTLASVHAARAQRIYPDVASLDFNFCRECKGYLQDGTGAHRTNRASARSKRARVAHRQLHVHCTACGADNALELPVDSESVSQFPMPRARARALVATAEARTPTHPPPVPESITPAPGNIPRTSQTPSLPPSTPRSGSPATPTPETKAQAKSKKRPKNKAGLQELLARKKQTDSSKAVAPANALSSFLSTLS